jgi:hydrogenase accessory protein HypB
MSRGRLHVAILLPLCAALGIALGACTSKNQILTRRANRTRASLAAVHVDAALRDLNLEEFDVLFIESSSSATFPVDLDLGQDVRVAVFSVSGGDDKAEQSPQLVRESDAVVLTKMDLLPHVPFNLHGFRNDVQRLNPSAQLIEVSSLRAGQIQGWLDWLESRRRQAWRQRRDAAEASTAAPDEPMPEWFFG